MSTDLANWQDATKDQFAFGKNAYLEAIPDLSYSMAAAKGIGGMQGRAAYDQSMLSSGLAKRRGQFDGMEDKFSTEAFDLNSQANQDKVAGKAGADVVQKFGDMQGQTARQLSRMGVNPNSGRALAMGNQNAIAQAGATVNAMNGARDNLANLAADRQKTAIGFGSQLNNDSIQAAQTASGIGNSALNSAQSPLKDRLNFAGGVSNIYSNAASGYKDLWQSQNLTAAQRANIEASNADRDTQEQNGFLGALGALAGSAGGSDLISKGASALWNF